MAFMLQIMKDRDVRTSGSAGAVKPGLNITSIAPPPSLHRQPVCSYISRAGRFTARTGRGA